MREILPHQKWKIILDNVIIPFLYNFYTEHFFSKKNFIRDKNELITVVFCYKYSII